MSGADGDWEEILETGRGYEAVLAALRLREEGIDAHVVDQSGPETLPLIRAFSRVRVLVPAPWAERARQLLAQSVWLPEDADSSS